MQYTEIAQCEDKEQLEECLQIDKELKSQEQRIYAAMLDKHLARLY
ncbi:MAG: hypothetical protein IVW55_16050 [Chloroflexi bacterium]|nr:hypothetical protein [Chloroflexota bacterium]